MRPGQALLYFVAALLVLLAIGIGKGNAMDPYTGIQRPDNKGSCCGGGEHGDCKPMQHNEVRYNGKNYEVFVNGAWISVPNETIIEREMPGGGTHLCYNGQVLCFIKEPVKL